MKYFRADHQKTFSDKPTITEMRRITESRKEKYYRADHHYTTIFSNELFMIEIRNIT